MEFKFVLTRILDKKVGKFTCKLVIDSIFTDKEKRVLFILKQRYYLLWNMLIMTKPNYVFVVFMWTKNEKSRW